MKYSTSVLLVLFLSLGALPSDAGVALLAGWQASNRAPSVPSAEPPDQYNWVVSLKSPIESPTLDYSDTTIELEFIPMDEKQLVGPYTWAFILTNKSSGPITVNWETSFVTSLSGKRRAIYHGDMESISPGLQDSTTVQAGGVLGDAVTPRESVVLFHSEAHYDDYGRWVAAGDEIDGYQMFFGDDFGDADGYDQVRKAVVGREFELSLAMEVAGEPRRYGFVYRIDDIRRMTDWSLPSGEEARERP